ncbi:MAG: FHA domain-containing protein [Bacteroidaceae bacterium]|nr:FHA domain-containing protein [Bacteroidaceae bacterium]
MKKVRCPKCNSYTIFDETRYQPGQRLVFVCSECKKQFAIQLPASPKPSPEGKGLKSLPSGGDLEEALGGLERLGSIIVVENAFHYRQEIPLEMGDNVFGRFVQGTNINKPIETVDPSVDTRHCIIRVQRGRNGQLQYILRDAPSGTGTFYMNDILRDQDRIRLQDASIITIGATTLILKLSEDE